MNTNYPEDSIISDNVTYVGGVYYMSKQSGGIFYSRDAKGWHFIGGSDNARIISDRKRYSDRLIVFADREARQVVRRCKLDAFAHLFARDGCSL